MGMDVDYAKDVVVTARLPSLADQGTLQEGVSTVPELINDDLLDVDGKWE